MTVTFNLGGAKLGLTIGGATVAPPAATPSLVIGGAPAPTPDRKEEQLELEFPDHEKHGLDSAAILKYHQSLSPLGPDFSPAKSREAGLYFGYPDCCIDNYLAAHARGQHLAHQGAGGFIPCPKCLEKGDKDPKGLGSLIVNRVCARPYPNSVAAEDIRVLVEGRPTATMLRILRVHHRIDSDTSELTTKLIAAEDDKIRRMPRKAFDVAMEYLQGLK